jgi:hypothetical protein
VLLLLLALTGGGTAALLSRPPTPPRSAAPPGAADGRRADALPAPGKDAGPAAAEAGQPGKGLMTVSGDALLPDGSPAPGARVAVVVNRHRQPGEMDRMAQSNTLVLGTGVADAQGKFHLAVPQTNAQQHYLPTVLMCVPGYALAAEQLDRVASVHTVRPKLEKAQSVRGRLVGPGGEPAGGVRLRVVGMSRRMPTTGVALLFLTPPDRLPGWPDPVTTDADGRFVLAGLGPNLQFDLEADDERYAPEWFALSTGSRERAQTVTLTLAPVRTLEGRITEADTGRPLAGALVTADVNNLAVNTNLIIHTARRVATGRTDGDGRFRLRPFLGKEYTVMVYPPAGAPYLVAQKRLPWPAGAARYRLDLAQRRGVLVSGRVIEAGTRRPVAGAAVSYVPGPSGPQLAPAPGADRSVTWLAWDTGTAADGTFALAVFAGQGHLFLQGPTPDYVHVEVSSGQLHSGRPGGRPYFPDALVRLNLPPEVSGHRVVVALRRGVTVRGRVLGQDGTPVAVGVMISPTYVPEPRQVKGYPLPVRDGRFALPGCDPGRTVRVWFFDAKGQQGAVADIPGDPDAEPVVRLAPCQTGGVRIVDAFGRPLARPSPRLELVLRDGDPEDVAAQKGTLPRVSVSANGLYGPNYSALLGPDGWVTLPWLIPGATYTLRDLVRPERFPPALVTVHTKPGPPQLGNDAIEP